MAQPLRPYEIDYSRFVPAEPVARRKYRIDCNGKVAEILASSMEEARKAGIEYFRPPKGLESTVHVRPATVSDGFGYDRKTK